MSSVYRPPTGPLQFLFHDTEIIVVVKPSGLLSVPGRGAEKADCVAARLGALTVHRLDMETSGVMALAKTSEAQSALSRQFEARTVEKAYVAVVAGRVQPDAGEVDLPLITDWPNRPRQKVCFETGKPSLTRWRVLRREDASTRMALMPVTGRTHQLRVHMAELGHPILGDSLYAPPDVKAAAPWLLLHAETLAFEHPSTHQRMHFRAQASF